MDINAQDGKYSNGLQESAYHGHESVTQLLLSNGADINAQGDELGGALQAVAYSGGVDA